MNKQISSSSATVASEYLKTKGSKQRGISLPMMGIYIIVAALVVIPALVYGFKYVGKSKASNEVTALADLKTAVVNYAQQQGALTAANSSLAVLVSLHFFPQSMVSGTAAAPVVTNQWGGSMTVAPGTINTAGDSLVVTETGVPAAACTELGTSLDSVAALISINGTPTKTASATPSVAATVGSSCGGAAGDSNTIALTLSK